MISVTPCCLSRYSRSHRTWRACGSSPVVGSSRMSRSGWLMSERAMVSRRFIPPDSDSTLEVRRSASWAKSSSSSMRGRSTLPGQVEVATVDEQVLLHRELGVEVVLLGDHAEPGADRRPVDRRVELEHAERPGGDRGHRADHPHRRALTGTIRTEEPKRLPLADLEVDGVDGDEVVETLGELAGFHQGAHGEHTTGGPMGGTPTKGPGAGVLRSPRWARSTVSR